MSKEEKQVFHGSDVEKIAEKYGLNKDEITSFSANVNPLGISPLLREKFRENVDCIQRYPDREYRTLKEALARYLDCSPKNIMVGNGTTELISLFIGIASPRRAIIVGPTYSEYERSVNIAGGKTSYFPLREDNGFSLDMDLLCERITPDTDLIILCTPNNPTGTTVKRSDMRRLLDVAKERSCYVMVDETYIEFCDDERELTAIPLVESHNNIVVLRSTSKFFACPGLRLGYAITADDDTLSSAGRKKNPWMIHTLAAENAMYMFSDTEYIKETKELISSERERLYEKYKNTDRFLPFKPKANFMLMKIKEDGLKSSALFEKAIHENMMIRDCQSFPFLDDSFVRICFMKKEDNDRLFDCLTGSI